MAVLRRGATARDEHDGRAEQQLVEGVDEEQRRGHHTGQRDYQQPCDPERNEERHCRKARRAACAATSPSTCRPLRGYTGSSGVVMHSCGRGRRHAVSEHVGCGVRSDPHRAEDRRRGAGDESSDREEARALEITRGSRREGNQKRRGKDDESRPRLRAQYMDRRADSSIRYAHPHEHVSGDGEQEHGGPEVHMKNVEPDA